MKLTKNNIFFVKRLSKDDIIYSWFVVLKGYESRDYINYENGKTVVKEYKKEWLPKSVQSFINEHEGEVFTKYDEFTIDIFR